MKRLLVLSAVLVPLSLFIAGCGGGSGGPDAAQKAKAQDAIEKGKVLMQEQGKNTMADMMKKGQQGKMQGPAVK